MPNYHITIAINEKIYLRDPVGTDLGKRILDHSIQLLNEIGFEKFNFKRLANKMHSTEASVYRYFENKYRLLAYLAEWYWDFTHYRMNLAIGQELAPIEKIYIAIDTLVKMSDQEHAPGYIDLKKLHQIIVENSARVYHTKKVDTLNQVGIYANYKKIVKRISEIILEIDTTYEYPKSLAINILEQSLNYEYYLEHLPKLTDTLSDSMDRKESTTSVIRYMIDRILL